MRLFLALDLDQPARDAIATATGGLRDLAPEFSWVAPGKLHLTLRFLGEQEDQMPAVIGPATDAVAAAHRSFPMRLRHVGAFPNFRRARVVWLGVDSDPRLELLHHDVELACERLGFALEGRPFRPHVTLARLRHPAAEDVLRAFAGAAKRVDLDHEVMVERVDLMQSTTASGGSTYRRLHTSPLRVS